ncbi:hypothetical protein ACVIWV_000012 [Bradyrhizobium diazoefficiens]|uniref:Uncharacterized protein n=1 Tax=Bradyrhizobium diazoefficiens TaxID=1355477 RepID=A0A0E4FS72_9BRAD|nr:hypothetical protein NK6_2243 [Bradyrhizobium diazoefficiens]
MYFQDVEDNRADANENHKTTQPTAFDARSRRLLLPFAFHGG